MSLLTRYAVLGFKGASCDFIRLFASKCCRAWRQVDNGILGDSIWGRPKSYCHGKYKTQIPFLVSPYFFMPQQNGVWTYESETFNVEDQGKFQVKPVGFLFIDKTWSFLMTS